MGWPSYRTVAHFWRILFAVAVMVGWGISCESVTFDDGDAAVECIFHIDCDQGSACFLGQCVSGGATDQSVALAVIPVDDSETSAQFVIDPIRNLADGLDQDLRLAASSPVAGHLGANLDGQWLIQIQPPDGVVRGTSRLEVQVPVFDGEFEMDATSGKYHFIFYPENATLPPMYAQADWQSGPPDVYDAAYDYPEGVVLRTIRLSDVSIDATGGATIQVLGADASGRNVAASSVGSANASGEFEVAFLASVLPSASPASVNVDQWTLQLEGLAQFATTSLVLDADSLESQLLSVDGLEMKEVQIRVLDTQARAVQATVLVRTEGQGSNLLRFEGQRSTDDEGRVQVVLSEGEHRLWVVPAADASESATYVDVCIRDDALIPASCAGSEDTAALETLTIELMPKERFLFALVDADDVPIPNAEIQLSLQALPERMFSAVSDNDGRFETELDAFDHGTNLRLNLLATDLAARAASLSDGGGVVIVGETLDPEGTNTVRLPDTALFYGSVLDAEETPVSGARVFALSQDESGDWETLSEGVTDSGGDILLVIPK